MRALIWIVTAASLLYGGYWAVGASTLRSQIASQLDDWRDQGVADYSDMSLTGFPNRFDLTLSDPSFNLDTGIAWAAPFLQVFALSYAPNEVIVVWPHEQKITTRYEAIDITATDLRASASVRAENALPLSKVTLVGDTLALTSDAGWRLDLGTVRLATRGLENDPLAHDLGLELLTVSPSQMIRALIDPQQKMPAVLDRLHLDAGLRFDRAIDRTLTSAPTLTSLQVRKLTIAWGDVVAQAEGELHPDAYGYAEGTLMLQVSNWPKLLDFLISNGVILPEFAPGYTSVLTQMQVEGAPEGTARLPITFAGGQIALGLIPLGYAPRF